MGGTAKCDTKREGGGKEKREWGWKHTTQQQDKIQGDGKWQFKEKKKGETCTFGAKWLLSLA